MIDFRPDRDQPPAITSADRSVPRVTLVQLGTELTTAPRKRMR
jgi:hypothetical protein